MDEKMAEQSLLAIEEADYVLFLDARAGMTAADQMIAEHLRKRNKRSHVVANKIDNIDPEMARAEFAPLGMGNAIPMAGSQAVVSRLMERAGDSRVMRDAEEASKKNVAEGEEAAHSWPEREGRHQDRHHRPPERRQVDLVNRMLGEDRVVVYDQPGTTRDSIYIPFERDDEVHADRHRRCAQARQDPRGSRKVLGGENPAGDQRRQRGDLRDGRPRRCGRSRPQPAGLCP
jgi:GTP-binding protein